MFHIATKTIGENSSALPINYTTPIAECKQNKQNSVLQYFEFTHHRHTTEMKTSVIICEFNPLHSGHKKIIDFAKTFSDKVICVMSGNFVQRGMPACCNKYKRATHAIKAGADLVVELPTIYATSSAENFALGGVKIANRLNADFLVFGSECGEIKPLEFCAERLDDEAVNARIREHLAQGVSYPKALWLATGLDVLEKPNNVLAVEYLRALKKTNSSVVPVTIAREDNFNGAAAEFASSTFLRNNKTEREKYLPDFVAKDIDDTLEERYKEFATHFVAVATKEELENTAGISEGLHNKLFAADKTNGYDVMMEEVKSKRYTRLKLQRIVLNCVLGITKDLEKQSKNEIPKIKVLAVNSTSKTLLAGIENQSDELTKKADRLFSTFDGEKAPTKLLIMNN